jgi:hypothetical protein
MMILFVLCTNQPFPLVRFLAVETVFLILTLILFIPFPIYPVSFKTAVHSFPRLLVCWIGRIVSIRTSILNVNLYWPIIISSTYMSQNIGAHAATTGDEIHPIQLLIPSRFQPL